MDVFYPRVDAMVVGFVIVLRIVDLFHEFLARKS